MLSFADRMEILKGWHESPKAMTLDEYIESVLPNYAHKMRVVEKPPEKEYVSIIPKNYSGQHLYPSEARADDRVGEVVGRFESFYLGVAVDDFESAIVQHLDMPPHMSYYDAKNQRNVY